MAQASYKKKKKKADLVNSPENDCRLLLFFLSKLYFKPVFLTLSIFFSMVYRNDPAQIIKYVLWLNIESLIIFIFHIVKKISFHFVIIL